MRRGSQLLLALIVTATAAFVVGVAIERHQHSSETAREPARASGATHTESPSEHSRESGGGEAGEGVAGETGTHPETGARPGAGGASKSAEAGHTESSETLLGVNPESTALVAVAVVVSLSLAFAVSRASGVWWVLGAVAMAMGVFGALDVREVVHQANESRTGLTFLAGAVAALHLAAALLAARGALALGRSGPPLAPYGHAT